MTSTPAVTFKTTAGTMNSTPIFTNSNTKKFRLPNVLITRLNRFSRYSYADVTFRRQKKGTTYLTTNQAIAIFPIGISKYVQFVTNALAGSETNETALSFVATILIPEAYQGTRLPPLKYSSEIGRAHVGTPTPTAHLVCRLLLDN